MPLRMRQVYRLRKSSRFTVRFGLDNWYHNLGAESNFRIMRINYKKISYREWRSYHFTTFYYKLYTKLYINIKNYKKMGVDWPPYCLTTSASATTPPPYIPKCQIGGGRWWRRYRSLCHLFPWFIFCVVHFMKSKFVRFSFFTIVFLRLVRTNTFKLCNLQLKY